MDKLATQLRKDADDIHVEFSPQLDNRIRASLEAVEQARPPEPQVAQSPGFWWASSLTGLAAAVLVIMIVNSDSGPTPAETMAEDTGSDTALQLPELPAFPLKVEQAMTTSPLEQELTNIQSDLEKARQKVEEDVEKLVGSKEP